MKRVFAIIFSALLPIAAMAQGRVYESSDSIRIEHILHCVGDNKNNNTGELIITIADKLIGEKYVAGTLEQGIEEPLFISCTKLDCTTFVELVLAIAMTTNERSTSFNDVCRNLERIRYRNGKNNGYTSRLHYISWWITDNTKKGIVEDVTSHISCDKQLLNLYFMSTHPNSYPILADNPHLIKEIERMESPYRDKEVCYIPKENIGTTGDEKIKNGDIIAITTSIQGLDVTHIGFAYYNEGTLCLYHASSGKEKVTKETEPFRDYIIRNKRHTGIRVFRAVF